MDLRAVLEDVGRRVAELRSLRGLTQEQLAEVPAELRSLRGLTQEQLAEVPAELRSLRGLTQEQLAEVAGIDVSTLRKVERGERNITLRTVVMLANSLGCTSALPLFEAPTTPRARPGRPRRRG